MEFRKQISTLLLVTAFAVSKGQNARSIDLQGEWSMDLGKNTLYFDFRKDSTYKFNSYLDTTLRIDYYEVMTNKEEFVLELNMYTGTYIASKKTYLIRNIDSNSYSLQLPESNQMGEIL